eukprot:31057-Pelagococcus_subviridis.AAC.17
MDASAATHQAKICARDARSRRSRARRAPPRLSRRRRASVVGGDEGRSIRANVGVELKGVSWS